MMVFERLRQGCCEGILQVEAHAGGRAISCLIEVQTLYMQYAYFKVVIKQLTVFEK